VGRGERMEATERGDEERGGGGGCCGRAVGLGAGVMACCARSFELSLSWARVRCVVGPGRGCSLLWLSRVYGHFTFIATGLARPWWWVWCGLNA
jgi:hypothetical protein